MKVIGTEQTREIEIRGKEKRNNIEGKIERRSERREQGG